MSLNKMYKFIFTFMGLGSHFGKDTSLPFLSVVPLKYSVWSLLLQPAENCGFCCVPNKWDKDENLGEYCSFFF